MRANGPSEYLPKLDEVTVPISMVSFKLWWETGGGVRIEIVELQKLLLDLALHPISF